MVLKICRSKLPPIWTDRLFGARSRLRPPWQSVRLMFNDTSTPSIHNISYMMIVYNDCYNNICTLLYNLMHLLWHNLYLYASAMYMQNIMKMSNIYLCAHYIQQWMDLHWKYVQYTAYHIEFCWLSPLMYGWLLYLVVLLIFMHMYHASILYCNLGCFGLWIDLYSPPYTQMT